MRAKRVCTALLFALAVALATLGCAAKFGSGPDGWATWSFWEGFNIEVKTGVGDLCLGCLKVEEGATDSED